MTKYVINEDDGDILQVGPAGSEFGPGVLRLFGDGGGWLFLTSSVPALITALASLWREENPGDTNPGHAWLRDGIPTILGRTMTTGDEIGPT